MHSRRDGRAKAEDLDRHVGARMRDRRIMLGLTLQQLAELIGTTYQQAHKYEKGINRIAVGRLFTIAGALRVQISYFFEGVENESSPEPTRQQRLILDFAQHFTSLPRCHQEALCELARVLAQSEYAVRSGIRAVQFCAFGRP
jgi:transcriptional regulator with XRE-family HTH domain